MAIARSTVFQSGLSHVAAVLLSALLGAAFFCDAPVCSFARGDDVDPAEQAEKADRPPAKQADANKVGDAVDGNRANAKAGRDPVAMAFALPAGTVLNAAQQAAYDQLKAAKEDGLRQAFDDVQNAKAGAETAEAVRKAKQLREEIRAAIQTILASPDGNAQPAQQAGRKSAPNGPNSREYESSYNPNNETVTEDGNPYYYNRGSAGYYPYSPYRHYYDANDYRKLHPNAKKRTDNKNNKSNASNSNTNHNNASAKKTDKKTESKTADSKKANAKSKSASKSKK